MTKTRTVLIISFLVIFAAGVGVGLFVGWRTRPRRRGSRLARELDLTQKQREQMRKIWTESLRGAPRQAIGERRQELREERDQAFQDLLDDKQKAQHKLITEEYSRKQTELSEERKKLFQDAVEKTKLILSESQRKKYEELLKSRGGRGRGGHRGNQQRRTTGSMEPPRRGE